MAWMAAQQIPSLSHPSSPAGYWPHIIYVTFCNDGMLYCFLCRQKHLSLSCCLVH